MQIERIIKRCNNNNLYINISKANELVLDYSCRFMRSLKETKNTVKFLVLYVFTCLASKVDSDLNTKRLQIEKLNASYTFSTQRHRRYHQHSLKVGAQGWCHKFIQAKLEA